MATGEWITRITLGTNTNGSVIYNRASSIEATRARARIATFLPYTGEIALAFGIYCAFWSTIGWGANIGSKART